MTSYRKGSKWNDLNELRCLLILKQLEAEKFKRNRQAQLCRELSQQSGLSEGTIKAKVGNYKSVAGITNHSNASTNTISIYKKYGNYSVNKINSLISSGKAL